MLCNIKQINKKGLQHGHGSMLNDALVDWRWSWLTYGSHHMAVIDSFMHIRLFNRMTIYLHE